MNFFGHAVVACRRAPAPGPAFVLGAMLPDLAAMCGGRVVEIADAEVAAGVRHHHETDRVFHAAPAFRRLCRDAEAGLSGRGVGRGGARGAAHVGVELLLDGLLVDEEPARSVYERSVARAHAGDLGAALRWHAPEQAERWAALQRRLAGASLAGYRDLDVVAERVARALARRPLLALAPAEVAAVREELPRMRDATARVATALVAEVTRAVAPIDTRAPLA
jgi:hypothetical protein